MKIDRKTIEHLEALAKIELSEIEREKLAVQLNRIVELVEQLHAVDTSGAKEIQLAAYMDAEHVRFDDRVPGLEREDVLSRAPDVKNGFFRVPRVIDRDKNK